MTVDRRRKIVDEAEEQSKKMKKHGNHNSEKLRNAAGKQGLVTNSAQPIDVLMALSGGTKAATESQLVRENIETLVAIAPKTRVAFLFELDESLAVFMEGEVNRVEDSKYFV